MPRNDDNVADLLDALVELYEQDATGQLTSEMANMERTTIALLLVAAIGRLASDASRRRIAVMAHAFLGRALHGDEDDAAELEALLGDLPERLRR